jgi:aspartokinase/homoserine dehydrogenase 1
VVDNDIPLKIRNTFNTGHPGTRITKSPVSVDNIKGITAIGNMALVNLEGAGMIGVPGTADRMFSALKKAGVSVTLISQASSEHSICIAVPQDLAARATMVIKDAFAVELASGQIQSVDRTDAQSIVAVVGDGMKGMPGIASRFFGTLARAGINVRAIAQGSSERNISAVVDSADATRALRAAHSGFYLSSKTISVGLIGPGTVGATLLKQIEARAGQLITQFNLDIRVRAIARSGTMLLSERRIDLDNWQQEFSERHVDLDFAAFEQWVNPDHLPHAVIIDCTASDEIASRYTGWLERGIHVITPNKRACSGSLDAYRELQSKARSGCGKNATSRENATSPLWNARKQDARRAAWNRAFLRRYTLRERFLLYHGRFATGPPEWRPRSEFPLRDRRNVSCSLSGLEEVPPCWLAIP